MGFLLLSGCMYTESECAGAAPAAAFLRLDCRRVVPRVNYPESAWHRYLLPQARGILV